MLKQVFAADVVGGIVNPLSGQYRGVTGPITFLGNVLRLAFIAAGIWAFLNVIIAGFQFISAGGDAKAVGAAWSRIWQSLLGLVLIVASFALATIFSQILFGRPDFILKPELYTP